MTADLVTTHRPQYHFLPPRNWMNDPNGLIQFRGVYHMFYQHNPVEAKWGNMTWGHATSTDLVHWQHHPFALHRDQPYDKDGVFSGCAVDDNGTMTIVYTGVTPQVQCVATSADGMTFTKYAGNPILPKRPEGPFGEGFRDPFVWRDGDTWFMVVGGDLADGAGGAIFLYRSRDLRAWEYIGTLCEGDPTKTGLMWECPCFFPLGDKWVLIVAPQPLAKAIYFVGRYENFKFIAESQSELDPGGSVYAPQVFRDDQGRWILFGWCYESRPEAVHLADGWAGTMTLPRVLTLGDDKKLRFAVADEARSLRGANHHFAKQTITSAGIDLGVGDAVELELTLTDLPKTGIALKLRRSPNGEEETILTFANEMLAVDRTRSSLDDVNTRDRRETPLKLAAGEPLHLHVWIDRSVIEIFANDRACLTTRVYPTRPDATGIRLSTLSDTATLICADAWTMKAIE